MIWVRRSVRGCCQYLVAISNKPVRVRTCIKQSRPEVLWRDLHTKWSKFQDIVDTWNLMYVLTRRHDGLTIVVDLSPSHPKNHSCNSLLFLVLSRRFDFLNLITVQYSICHIATPHSISGRVSRLYPDEDIDEWANKHRQTSSPTTTTNER